MMRTNITMKTVVFVVVVFVAAGIGGLRTPEAAENGSEKKYEWPMVAGDAGWTGYSPDPSAKPPFRLKWVTQPGRGVGATLAVAGGKVFYRGGGCLDAETGEVLWKANTGASALPSYYKGRLYFGAKNSSRLTVYDAATGKRLWQRSGYRCSRDYRASLTVCDGAIYVGKIKEHEGKKFYFGNALDAESGKEIWSTPLAAVVEVKPRGYHLGMTMGSPAVGGGRVFFSSHSPKGVYAVDQKTGKKLWTQEGVCDSSELGTDGKTVWAAQAVQGMWALNAETGKRLWHWGREWKDGKGKSAAVSANYAGTDTAKFPPVVAYGMLFTSNYGRRFTALEAGTGKQLWVAGDRKCQVWAGTCGRPTAAGGYVYSNGTTGKDFNGPLYRFAAYAFDPKAQKVVWQHPVSGKACARISIAYGRLYVPTGAEIYCFEPVGSDYRNEPQALPSAPAGPLTALAKPFAGKPGEAAAGGKPKGGTDWPMYGGCPARCGLELAIGLPIKEAWKFQTGGKVKSSPVIAGGLAFAGSDSGEFFAIDLKTGTKKWSAKITPHPESKDQVKWIKCSPAVAEGIVVVGADDGVMRAFDAKTGTPKWQFRTAGRIRSSPAIIGERVVFGSWDGRCYCVRLTDGKEFWRWRIGDPGVRLCTPVAVGQGRVYVNAWEDFKVHAIDLGTGKPLPGYKTWSGYGTKVGLVQGLAIYRGTVVTSKASGRGQPINPDSGTVVGRGFGGGSMILPSLPAFHGDMVYHNRSSRGGSLSEVLSNQKKPKKKRRLALFKNPGLNAPLVCGNLMIVATGTGTLEAHRLPDEGSDEPSKQIWEWKSASGAEICTAPAAGSGFVVLGSDDGHIYAFAYSESSASTARAASEVANPIKAKNKKSA